MLQSQRNTAEPEEYCLITMETVVPRLSQDAALRAEQLLPLVPRQKAFQIADVLP